MHIRGALLVVGLAVAATGCSSLGLDPYPESDVEKKPTGSLGLDPFPAAVHPGRKGGLGLDAFPDRVTKDDGRSLGLDPFPAKKAGKGGTPGLGIAMDPFPKAMHPGGSSDTGLDPFPVKKAREGDATASGGVPASTEYPPAPPLDVRPAPRSSAAKETEVPAPK